LYEDRGYEVPLPVALWAEVRGEAGCSLNGAVEAFANAAGALRAFLAFAANAALSLEVELAYDSTPGIREREYLQVFVARAPARLPPSRRILPEPTMHALRSLASHRNSTQIHCAIAHYAEALEHWHMGEETVALGHVYIAAEALTQPMCDAVLRARRMDRAQLASAWGIEKKRLNNEVRARLIFGRDAACYKRAKEARDGYFHAFRPLANVREDARATYVAGAQHLREAVLKLLRPGESVVKRLTSPPFDKPRGPLVVDKYLRGTLLSESDEVAAEDQEYPIMLWQSGIRSVSLDATGMYIVAPEDTITARFATGVRLANAAIEYWDASLAPHPPPDGGQGASG
jgi:hypothetical protein